MSATHIQVVKWTFPAFALIIGLLWYKRRRADRPDPGGTGNPDCSDQSIANYKRETASSKSSTNLYDSGIQFDQSFSLNSFTHATEEMTCCPRKRSESLDIPQRKIGIQTISNPSTDSPIDDPAWYNYADASSTKMEVQHCSNPKISNFEMVVRSRSASSVESASDSSGKVFKIFENVTEEEEKMLPNENSSFELVDKHEETGINNECDYISSTEPPVTTSLKDSVKTQAQALSERDFANHSPVSGVLEGSVTDEARSEGSTDSGKGGSIKGHTKCDAISKLYEFSLPQNLVGRIIGRDGSFLENIRVKAEVSIIVKRDPISRGHYICAIEGSMDRINVALGIIRQRFPVMKYPQVTLEQISLLKVPEEIPWIAELTQLSLIEGVNNDVVVCHVVKPNRFFVQLPTHPTYPTLRMLDENMTQLYNNTESPPVPAEISKGMIFVGKWYSRWVRVYVEEPDPHGERHLVRLVDHGGYWFFSNVDMKKIRSDYLTLPFQAIEIFLANTQPKNGYWVQEAVDVVAQMCYGIVGQAQIEGYINESTYVNLFLNIQKHGVISLADELVARGFADFVPLESIVPEENISFS